MSFIFQKRSEDELSFGKLTSREQATGLSSLARGHYLIRVKETRGNLIKTTKVAKE